MRGLDAWITGGRYRAEHGLATCPECGETSPVTAESEYGSTVWLPEECPTPGCGRSWTGDEPWDDDEPDPDAARDRLLEERVRP